MTGKHTTKTKRYGLPFIPSKVRPTFLVLLGLLAVSSQAAPAKGHRAPSQQAPGMICDVTKYKAQADGRTVNTEFIQNAINACGANPGGGTVVFPKTGTGVYLSNTIKILHDNITLHFDAGATLRGVQGVSGIAPETTDTYPWLTPETDNSQLLNCRRALIYAYRVHNLIVEGPGTIDGNGGFGPWGGNAKEATRPMAIFIVQSGRSDIQAGQTGRPSAKADADADAADPSECSSIGSEIGAGPVCNGVTIQNVSVVNAGMWGVVTMETDHIHVDHLNVNSPFGPTRDGIDITDGHHVLIENSTMLSEDDSYCLKSGVARGTVDLMVRNSRVVRSSVANGLKIGTATTGAFKDITFDTVTVTNVDKAAMVVESIDGSEVQNINFRNIAVQKAGTPFFIVLGMRSGGKEPVGKIDGVTFENITATETKHPWGSPILGSIVNGTTFSPTNITFNHVKAEYQPVSDPVPPTPPEYQGQYPDPNRMRNPPGHDADLPGNQDDLPGKALFIRHVKGITLTDTQFTMETGPSDPRPYVSAIDWSGTIAPDLFKP